MASYKIIISASAEKRLKSIPKRDVPRIVASISSLAFDPRPVGSRKLAGEKQAFRIRVGLYRIIYEIKNKELVVLVLKLGHRKDIYK